MSKARITFLGTSDGLPSADRHHASLLLELGGRVILLDCGEPCSHTLKRMGVDFDGIGAVFLTHMHSDHVGGFPMLVQSMWLERRTRPLPVWLPRRAIAPLRHWLHACYLYEPVLPFRLQWRPLANGTVARCGPVRVRACRTSHLDPARAAFAKRHPEIGFDPFCFLIEGAGKRIGYSGDIGRVEDLRLLLARPLDLLVTELAHCAPGAMFEFLRDAPVKRVALTHLCRDARSRFAEVRRLGRRTLGAGRAVFVDDGDRLDF